MPVGVACSPFGATAKVFRGMGCDNCASMCILHVSVQVVRGVADVGDWSDGQHCPVL